MSRSNLFRISYYNTSQEIRLSAYADTIVFEPVSGENIIRAIRIGGYPEVVHALSDAIYAGGRFDVEIVDDNMKAYRTIDEVLQSPWADRPARSMTQQTTDRILRSTKLEDSIYADLRSEDDALDEIEAAAKKLSAFPALSRDVYQSFYSLMPKRNEESELSCMAQRFNQKILDHVTNGEEFKKIKNICEGRELPAYEAATEFISQTAGELDHLIAGIEGEKGTLNTLNRR